MISLRTLHDFYETRLGQTAGELLWKKIHGFLDDNSLKHKRVGVCGWPNFLHERLENKTKLMVPLYPFAVAEDDDLQLINQKSSVLIEGLDWPFAAESFDTLILVHSVEHCHMVQDLLDECWRILKPGGHLILCVPNRRGALARSDLTPFGYGQAYSLSQLEAPLEKAKFTTVQIEGSLMTCGCRSEKLMGFMLRFLEPLSWVVPSLAGVWCFHAMKTVHMPSGYLRRERVKEEAEAEPALTRQCLKQ